MNPQFYRFTVKNDQDDIFIDEITQFDLQTVEELRAKIDLWGLFNCEVLVQVVDPEKDITNHEFNMYLNGVTFVALRTFEVAIEYTYEGERLKESFFIDTSELLLTDVLKEHIRE